MSISTRDLMTLQAYSLHRHDHRRRLVAHRRLRTLTLGPSMQLQFEDEMTVRHQIQEVLWADRHALVDDTSGAAQAEIDTYAHLVPNGTQWKATLLIGLPDADERERLMPLLNDAVHELYVELRQRGRGPTRVNALVNEDLPCRHRGRPSGVHFLRFQFDGAFRLGLAQGGEALLGCAHPGYHWRRVIPPATLASLCRELVVPGRIAPAEVPN